MSSRCIAAICALIALMATLTEARAQVFGLDKLKNPDPNTIQLLQRFLEQRAPPASARALDSDFAPATPSPADPAPSSQPVTQTATPGQTASPSPAPSAAAQPIEKTTEAPAQPVTPTSGANSKPAPESSPSPPQASPSPNLTGTVTNGGAPPASQTTTAPATDIAKPVDKTNQAGEQPATPDASKLPAPAKRAEPGDCVVEGDDPDHCKVPVTVFPPATLIWALMFVIGFSIGGATVWFAAKGVSQYAWRLPRWRPATPAQAFRDSPSPTPIAKPANRVEPRQPEEPRYAKIAEENAKLRAYVAESQQPHRILFVAIDQISAGASRALDLAREDSEFEFVDAALDFASNLGRLKEVLKSATGADQDKFPHLLVDALQQGDFDHIFCTSSFLDVYFAERPEWRALRVAYRAISALLADHVENAGVWVLQENVLATVTSASLQEGTGLDRRNVRSIPSVRAKAQRISRDLQEGEFLVVDCYAPGWYSKGSLGYRPPRFTVFDVTTWT